MKLRNRIFSLLVPALLLFSGLKAQTPHAPVSAGTTKEERADSISYKAAEQRDRERIKAAIKQGRENLEASKKPNEELRTKKLIAKIATYAVFGIIALVFYIRKKKKAKNTGGNP